MGAIIPPQVAETATSRYLAEQGLVLLHRGKVRDTYQHPFNSSWLVVVATDRLSVFDLVLPALIPYKGEVLTAMTLFWLTKVLVDFPHHLEPSEKDHSLNAVHDLKDMLPRLPLKRCLVVRKETIQEYELIFRHHIGGSVYKTYLETGTAGGHKLPSGLPKWSVLEDPLFTPSTKAEIGHDVNITAVEYFADMGKAGEDAVAMFSRAYKRAYAYARERGIIILDTKFEGGSVIADEVLTPDSSRFTTVDDWQQAVIEDRDPIFYDKEPVRQWGKTVETPWGTGLHNKSLDPQDPEHTKFVASLHVPSRVVDAATKRYLDLARAMGAL